MTRIKSKGNNIKNLNMNLDTPQYFDLKINFLTIKNQ